MHYKNLTYLKNNEKYKKMENLTIKLPKIVTNK